MNKKIILGIFFITILLLCSEVLGSADYPPTNLANFPIEIELTTNKNIYNHCEMVHYFLTNLDEVKIIVRGPAFFVYDINNELVDQFAIFAHYEIEPGETKHIVYSPACYREGKYHVIGRFQINGKIQYALTEYFVKN